MDELVQDFNNALDETAESTSSNRSGTIGLTYRVTSKL